MPTRRLLCLVLAVCAVAADEQSCASGECKDKATCAKKFGAKYEILTQPAPATRDGNVEVQVSYTSDCADGGSAFEAKKAPPPPNADEDSFANKGVVLYLHRAEPECESRLPFTKEWTGLVTVPLPEGSFEYIAFPPDGQFDMYSLKAL
uniref:Uncharacterized protein n=2 Tax=Prymnesium polylepis TaxID=72548 RepID=A0A7S4HQC5_9EUKA